ncbi:hypothetical protein EcE24377A_3324 [Escherichia coli O139:H28 str. E24377A]|uniref:Uncharacterized protein n=1 Tax=Escherichia coli O139:H28 (strain E24377A / ETEC) TaxID=331111 RepID=A7ZRA3_ECO24|nr:hypothetical protein EcE24377A_3324 [Escherichia coli O139:H28 str. E24377A]
MRQTKFPIDGVKFLIRVAAFIETSENHLANFIFFTTGNGDTKISRFFISGKIECGWMYNIESLSYASGITRWRCPHILFDLCPHKFCQLTACIFQNGFCIFLRLITAQMAHHLSGKFIKHIGMFIVVNFIMVEQITNEIVF